MFQLDRAIDDWCRIVAKHACLASEDIDELKDHLYCEVDHFLQQNFSESQAFARATERLGQQETLIAELFKNRNWLARNCPQTILRMKNHLTTWSQNMPAKRRSVYLIAVSFLFAGLILLSSWIVPDKEATTAMFLLIALWWVPYSFLGGNRQAVGEFRCLKRKALRIAGK